MRAYRKWSPSYWRKLKNHRKTTALLQLGLPDIFIPQGTQQEALAEFKLDEKGIEEQIIAFIKG